MKTRPEIKNRWFGTAAPLSTQSFNEIGTYMHSRCNEYHTAILRLRRVRLQAISKHMEIMEPVAIRLHTQLARVVQPEQNQVSLQLRNNPQCLGPNLHLPGSSPAAQHLHLYGALKIKGDHTGFPHLMHIHQDLIRKQLLPFPAGL
ncbi:hypothetical protein D3C71_1771970 [compost metagenome]